MRPYSKPDLELDRPQNEKLEAEAEEARKNVDPTAAARAHGNEPSKGAKIDKQSLSHPFPFFSGAHVL